MAELLRHFDRLSFWLGFIAASLFWLLVTRLRPMLRTFFASLRAQSQVKTQERSQSDEIRLGNDTLRYVQAWHIAAPMFSLDEVIVPPRLLAPAVLPMAYEPAPSEDITDWVIPFMPDWPEMGSHYSAPWLTPLEALQGGARLAIVGQPGSGKSVALANLAVQMIRKDPEAGDLLQFLPVVVHVADLPLPASDAHDVLGPLQAALASYVTSIPAKRLPLFVQKVFKGGYVVLLVDGLDELAPAQMEPVTEYLTALLQAYPKLRLVAAAHPTQMDGLAALGFQALPLATWGPAQRALFISRWNDLWEQYVAAGKKTSADALMIMGWLLTTTEFLTPLEFTLKVWAAFAGDALGPSTMAAFEAYLRRMLAGQPAKNRKALEQMAAQMALTMQPLVDGKTAGNWLGGSETVTAEADSADETGFAEKGRGKDKSAEKVRARGALPDLIEAGILASHDPLVRLAHPALLGYLAAQGLASVAGKGGTQLVAQPEWSGKQAALSYLAVMDAQAAWMQNLLQDEQLDVTLSGLLSAGRWLRHAPDGLPWIPTVLRLLAGALQKETLPMALKTRIVTALALAKTSGIAVLLRQMSSASQPELRQLAALGLGIVKDAKALGDLLRLQHEPNPVVNRAAILALVAMGDKAGLEAVATQLLSGDESQRRAAAEGLANHPEDGHPTLEEAAGVTDPGVRRAAVYGLVRTRQGWAISLLEKLRAEDSQWIVQDAANQVLSALEGNNPRLPQALPDLTHTAWLLAFAAERGLAVAPGKPAVEMLYRSLKEGSEDQRMAAAYYLSRHPHADSLIPLYRMYFAERGELHERAWEAIWCQGAAGIQLPPPAQFDYR